MCMEYARVSMRGGSTEGGKRGSRVRVDASVSDQPCQLYDGVH